MSTRQINLITWCDCFICNDYSFTELAKLGFYHSPPLFTTVEIRDVDLLHVPKNEINRPSNNSASLCSWTVCAAPLPGPGRLFWEKESRHLPRSLCISFVSWRLMHGPLPLLWFISFKEKIQGTECKIEHNILTFLPLRAGLLLDAMRPWALHIWGVGWHSLKLSTPFFFFSQTSLLKYNCLTIVC